ncbi:hypothetical protein [Sphingosinicella sp. BN140058]|uniref:hypothetical protein n=1 Tax=Sphingosinicella sp. BN140058 TaxID=1892855 RepID=UPI00101106DB|nr:hypothetical protein [Sphingosinicella sp. BN140058]QAY78059.1 hypothetical protein ETR14_17170 [Sphingosinicella sp. BN140058]
MNRPTQFGVRRIGEPSPRLRRFEVVGEDADGFLHSFHTDDMQQALDIAEIMRDDLANVRMETHDQGGKLD